MVRPTNHILHMAKRKFYVVWEGRVPGIYDDWAECLDQIDKYPGARYKAFDSQTAATIAFRGDPDDQISIIQAIADHSAETIREKSASILNIPEINHNAIAVDGAAAGNPGPIEYRGVDLASGSEIFHVGPLEDGTNNVAEYLAIIHALAYLYNKNDFTTPIYSDSRTARSWVRRRGNRSSLQPTPRNAKVLELLARADLWIQTHSTQNPVLCWNTSDWGEIPADFGRK